MSREIVIQVSPLPLPRTLVEADEYNDLSAAAKDAFLAHVRYVQELPFKLREWLDDGASSAELSALISRVDLDLMINLGRPVTPDDAISPWRVNGWVAHSRPLTSFIDSADQVWLNQPVPLVGASLGSVEQWVRGAAEGLGEMLDGFFRAKTFDQAVAYLVAVYVLMAGLKFGLGRVSLALPSESHDG